MDKLDTLIIAIQIVIVPIASLRIIGYVMSISSDPDSAHNYTKRIKNVLGYCIFAEIVLPIIKFFSGYMV